MKRIAVAVTLAALLAPAAAHAGTYHVYTCAAAGKTWANGAWKATTAAGVSVDTSCAGGTIGLSVAAGARSTNNTSAALTFTSPAGTTIANFSLSRQIDYRNPIAADTHRYFLLYTLGSTHFAGAGNFQDATRNALNAHKHWYGHPEANATVAKSTVTRATFPALASYANNARTLILRAGCYNRGTPCSVNTGGAISHLLHGSDVTVDDPTPPAVTVEASGLLAGGSRAGSDPVTLTATDGAGIRLVEIVDSEAGVVGFEDYRLLRTDANRICDFTLPAPCPALSRETIRATSLPAGQRQLFIRVTDTGGNVVQRGPYQVFAVTPSDRGAVNGTDATETGTLDVRWTKNDKATRRTLSYGTRAGIRGRLLNSEGRPIAGAKVQLLTRDLRRDARLIPRTMVVTEADGTFRTTVRATASRLLHFGWAARANDVRYGANGYLTLKARAAADLRVSTRRPRVGRAFMISGRLKGVSRGSVPVIVQGRSPGSGRYETFADTTTSSAGRFKVTYRFRAAASRGKTFVFRARIRPAARFPYETGYSRTVTVRVR